jgi:hypothetical protein
MNERRRMGPEPTRGRVPWWAYGIAISFIFYYAVMVYSERWAPRRFGADYEFTNGSMVMTSVDPASSAGRAGLRPGDRILTFDHQPISAWSDWRGVRARCEPGVPYEIDLLRGSEFLAATLTFGRQRGDSWPRLEKKRFVQAFVLLLAIFLAFHRPFDRAARAGAFLWATFGTAPLFPDAEMISVWRDLPVLCGALLWIPEFSHFMLLPLLFSFYALFPRPLFRSRSLWLIIWLPAIIAALPEITNLARAVYLRTVPAAPPNWLLFVAGLSILLYGFGSLTALVVNYTRSSLAERRRLRLFAAGSLLGWTPGLLFLTAIFWGPLTDSELVWAFVATPYRLFALSMATLVPLTLLHAFLNSNFRSGSIMIESCETS